MFQFVDNLTAFLLLNPIVIKVTHMSRVTKTYLNSFLFLFHQLFDIAFNSFEQTTDVNGLDFGLHQQIILEKSSTRVSVETHTELSYKKNYSHLSNCSA